MFNIGIVGKRYLAWKEFVSDCGDFSKMEEADLKELRNYRSKRLELLVYNKLKRKLFKDFSEGRASPDYVDGFLAALASHHSITSLKSEPISEE